jgi:mycothiol synthase
MVIARGAAPDNRLPGLAIRERIVSMTVFSWRPIGPGDVAEWAALVAAIQAADGDSEYASEQDLLEMFDDPSHDFARGSVAVLDGTVMVGYCLLMKRSEADPVHRMRHEGGVHPSYRNCGLGSQLVEWAEKAAVPIHEDAFGGHPLALSGFCLQSNVSAAGLFESHGYRPLRWLHLMTIDLTQPLRDVLSPPPGVEIVDFTPERSEEARLVRNEAFRDHWGSTETTAEGWAHLMGSNAFRPACSFLAYEAGEALGIILALEYDAYFEATGIRDLFIGLVGTRRAGRKRGIASALVNRALTQAQAAGFVRASLDVQSDSMTGAVGLYQRLGFAIDHSVTYYEKMLTAS